jgi:hypothetical protein
MRMYIKLSNEEGILRPSRNSLWPFWTIGFGSSLLPDWQASILTYRVYSYIISFHTSLVVIRPARSDGVKISPLRVRFRLLTVVLASRSSVKLAMVSCVFIGGVSVPPAGGSAIRQGFPARYTTQQLYIALISTTTFLDSRFAANCWCYLLHTVPDTIQ